MKQRKLKEGTDFACALPKMLKHFCCRNALRSLSALYRFFLPCFLCCLGLFLAGCSRRGHSQYNGYYIYCLDTNETRVASEEYTPSATETEPLIRELMKRMEQEPKDISLKKAIPDNVILDEYILTAAGDLSLYWTASYGSLSGVSEILRRAAIVKTLCQIPEIKNVQFYVSGQPLTDSNMNAIGFMASDTFIDNTGDDAYMQTATLNMYYSNSQGTGLLAVPVKVTYDATIPLEQLAMEQLIKGPDNIQGTDKDILLKTIPEGTKINKISVKENTCYLDLSAEFLLKRSNISDDVAIYSVVNTLVELPNINKVQFSINGEQVLLFDDTVNFGEPFENNLSLVN